VTVADQLGGLKALQNVSPKVAKHAQATATKNFHTVILKDKMLHISIHVKDMLHISIHEPGASGNFHELSCDLSEHRIVTQLSRQCHRTQEV